MWLLLRAFSELPEKLAILKHMEDKSQSYGFWSQVRQTYHMKGQRPWFSTNGIPFWDRCTTHFSRDFSGGWDVHWGYGVLTHGHIPYATPGTRELARCSEASAAEERAAWRREMAAKELQRQEAPFGGRGWADLVPRGEERVGPFFFLGGGGTLGFVLKVVQGVEGLISL